MEKHGGNILAASKKYALKPESFIDFSSNINPLGFPRKIKNIIKSSINKLVLYPEPSSKNLSENIALKLGLSPENVFMGNGAVELIYLVLSVLKPTRVLIPIPAFSEYEYACAACGSNTVFLESFAENDFKQDINKILEAIDTVDMLILCNPNNPTGQMLALDSMKMLLKKCEEKNVFMMVDEAFIDFVENPEKYSLINDLQNSSKLIILRSLTKFFAIPGLRLGYLLTNNLLVEQLVNKHYPWNLNVFAQSVGVELLKYDKFITKTKQYNSNERKYFFEQLKSIEWLQPYSSKANYIFCQIKKMGMSSILLTDKLAQRGILIRDCSNYRGLDNSFIRIAVKKRAENKILLKELKDLFKND